jgi:hypothetical protein
MGWCGGTQIFDATMDALIECVPDDATRVRVARALADCLWDGDWDCEHDSKHFETYLLPLMIERGFADPEYLS